jgi:hypothetical protein
LVLQQYGSAYEAELGRHFPCRLLTADVDAAAVAAPRDVEWSEWTILHATVDLWSIGVGLVTTIYDVRACASEWVTFRDGLDAERERLRSAAASIAAEAGPAAAASLNIPPSPVWGQLLWMHVIVLVEASDGAGREDLDAIASVVAYGGLPAALDPTIAGAAVRFKLDACAAYVSNQREVAAAAARMTAVHTAIWAAAAGFDRVLLDALLTPRGRQIRSLAALEDRADELLDLYQRVHAFRTRLEALPLHLGPLDGPLWRAVAEQWGLAQQLEGLVARFDTLEHVHSHLLDAVSGRRARRLGAFVLVFTVASVITFGITVINFSQARLESPRAVNIEALAALFALAAIVGAIAFALARRGLGGPEAGARRTRASSGDDDVQAAEGSA